MSKIFHFHTFIVLEIVLEKYFSHISYGEEIFKITESRRLSTKVSPILFEKESLKYVCYLKPFPYKTSEYRVFQLILTDFEDLGGQLKTTFRL